MCFLSNGSCGLLSLQFSSYFPSYFDGQYWLWWVFLVLGELLTHYLLTHYQLTHHDVQDVLICCARVPGSWLVSPRWQLAMSHVSSSSSLQGSCSSSEASSITHVSARWPTPSPHYPEPASSSSTENLFIMSLASLWFIVKNDLTSSNARPRLHI